MKSLPDEIFENCISPNDKLSDLPSSAGIVLFADSQNLPILLLAAANIRRIVKNKLAEKIDKTKRADLKSVTAKIYYTICPCKFRLALAFHQATKKTFGQNYKDHETIVYPWFVKIDLNEKIPFFSVTKKPVFNKGEKILGPFPGQKAAANFLKTLEDVYRLCKKCDLVNNPKQAAGCPYLQMDACCGVCGGKINCEDYRVLIDNAFSAGANTVKTIEKLQADMQTASKELSFEKAAELKRKIEKLTALKKQIYPHTNFPSTCTCSKSSAKISVLRQESQGQHSQTNRHSGKIGVGACRWTGDLRKLKILHIDKSAKIRQQGSRAKKQTFAVFVMNFFEIIDFGDFVIDEFEKVAEVIENALPKICCPSALAKATADKSESICDSTELIERFSIISYFLYRSNPSGLWINASEGFDRTVFAKTISEKFKL